MESTFVELEGLNPEEIIFALDIGTRNVVGTISVISDEKYVIIDSESLEHPERAMFDGQIHDIEKVAKIAIRIKKALEERNGIKLKNVAIAAAGRSLKTSKVKIEQDIDYTAEITKETVDLLEVAAIQLAQNEITPVDGESDVKYYCVGYNVIKYYLDGSLILNPEGHRGSRIGAEVIATFLPHIVVDSLYSVMNKAGLEVINMTLEPIAAINIVIPEGLRLLNLALVDVGAGTSDIAVTRDGSVVSFGMVSNAGDSLTEELSKELLMDFNSAEKLKISLSSNDRVEYTDVVGFKYEADSKDLLEKLETVIDKLATEITESIIQANGKAPSALFFIGGGSGIPGLTAAVSEKLKLPKERVTIKDTDSIQNLSFKREVLKGAEFITPIGIGYAAAKNKEDDFLTVTVNDKTVRLFNSRQLTVTDALVLIGYSARKLLLTRGEGYSIIENGSTRILEGEYGEPARIYVNGVISGLDTKLKNKDIINIEAATRGESPIYTVAEALKSKYVHFEGEKYSIYRNAKLNDEPCKGEDILKAGDRLDYELAKSAGDLEVIISEPIVGYELIVNGKLADNNYEVKGGDKIYRSKQSFKNEDKVEIQVSHEKAPVDSGEPKSREAVYKGTGYVETDYYSYEVDEYEVDEDGEDDSCLDDPDFKVVYEPIEKEKPVEAEEVQMRSYSFIINGKSLTVETHKKLVFVDIFDHYPFDLSKPQGLIELRLNGKNANYTDELYSGDIIEIYWKK